MRKPMTPVRDSFDPKFRTHRKTAGHFLRNGKWIDGCPFYLEGQFVDIRTMVLEKLALHATEEE